MGRRRGATDDRAYTEGTGVRRDEQRSLVGGWTGGMIEDGDGGEGRSGVGSGVKQRHRITAARDRENVSSSGLEGDRESYRDGQLSHIV
jgi:hypothetical protein